MKSLSLLIVVLTLIACQDKNPEPEAVNDNKFKTVRLERYAVQNGNPDSNALASYIIKDFDSSGLETKSVYYSSDDSVMMQFVNQYEDGNKSRVNWVNSDDQVVRYVKMTYDENDRMVRSETYSPDGEFKSGFIHRWKEEGRLEEKGPMEFDQAFKPNAFYRYNEQQEFESLKEYDENDSLYGTFTWKYLRFDEQEQWTERQMLFNDTLVRIEKRKISYQEE